MKKIDKTSLRAEEEYGCNSSLLQLEAIAKMHQAINLQAPAQRTEIRRNLIENHVPAVFVVDDEPRMCRSLTAILRNSGYQAAYSTSGESSLENIGRRNIDLILSDIHMPGLDGFELLERILTKMPGTPVIMMTGDATVDSAVKALRKGAYDYLKKPFEPEELLKTVENALQQKMLLQRTRILDNRLKISERRFRFLLQNIPDMIYTLDPAGRFKYINDPVAQTFGYRSTDLVGKNYESILWDEDISYARWRFNERRTGPRATSGMTLRLKPGPRQTNGGNANGDFTIIELHATGVYRKEKTNGKAYLIGTYGVIRNMSQYNNMHENPSDAKKLEKAIGNVLSEIGQDLNDMLSSTQNITSALKYKMRPGNPYLQLFGLVENYIKNSRYRVRHLLRLANGGKLDNQRLSVRRNTRKVTFRLKSSKARQVSLAGDFNGWDAGANPLRKDKDGLWVTSLVLPAGRYEFKFNVDGKWRENVEDESTVPNSCGTFNNVVNVGET